MLRQLARDSLVYGLGAVLSRFAGFLLLPIYARVLAPGEIGAIDLLTLALALVQVTVALEVAQGFARHYAERAEGPDRARLAATALAFTLIAYSAFVALGLLGAQAFADLLLGGQFVPAVRIAVGTAWFVGVLQLVLNQLRFQLRSRAYAAVNVLSVFASAGFSVLFVVAFHLGPTGVMAGQLLGAAIALGAAVLIARGVPRPAFHAPELRTMLRFSLPLVPSSLGVIVLISIDRIVISKAMGLDDVGVFGVAYRLAQLVGILMIGFQMALTPLIYQRHQDPETPRDLARIFRMFVAGALFLWIGLAAFSPLLVAVIATDRYLVAAPLVPVLAGAVILSTAQVFAPGLSLGMRTSMIAAINLGGALLNIVLNVALVPRFGLPAAAASTLTSTAVVFALNAGLGQRSYRVPFQWARIGAALIVAAGLGVAVQGIGGWTPLDIGLRVVAVAVVASACVAFGLVRRADVPHFFATNRAQGPA
jgi:O-antigen/teichoic acid export membrane protein